MKVSEMCGTLSSIPQYVQVDKDRKKRKEKKNT